MYQGSGRGRKDSSIGIKGRVEGGKILIKVPREGYSREDYRRDSKGGFQGGRF
jgi:hypothetical protein